MTLPAPDAASWTFALGLSACAHIGLAASLVISLSAAPGAAPQPGPEIILRSVPQSTARLGQPPERLSAETTPVQRLTALSETALPPMPEASRTATDLTPQRLSASPEPARAQVDTALRVPDAPQRAEALHQAPSESTLLRPLAPEPDPAPPTDLAAPPLAEPERLAALRPEQTRPTRLRPTDADSQTSAPRLQPLQAPPRIASTAPQRPSPSAAGSAQTASALPSPRNIEDSQRRAPILPPAEDTLERALRDRPSTFLNDRRAAPRPQTLTQPSPETGAQRHLAQIQDHLRSLPDIPCFAALVLQAPGNPVSLEVFGPAAAGLEAFRAALEQDTGPLPDMVLRPVTQAQCATLDFVRQRAAPTAPGLSLRLQARQVPSGSAVTGQIEMATARQAALLLVDATGQIQNLSQFLRLTGDSRAEFSIPMALQAPDQGARMESWNLLLAISADTPLASVETLSAPQDSAAFFARLRTEIAAGGHSPDLALIAFSLE